MCNKHLFITQNEIVILSKKLQLEEFKKHASVVCSIVICFFLG